MKNIFPSTVKNGKLVICIIMLCMLYIDGSQSINQFHYVTLVKLICKLFWLGLQVLSQKNAIFKDRCSLIFYVCLLKRF